MSLNEVNKRVTLLANRMYAKKKAKGKGDLYLGVDLGTANVVTVVVDEEGVPVDGEIMRGHVVREGMIVDYVKAIELVEEQIDRIHKRHGEELTLVASAVPPGTEQGNGRVTKNILEAAGLEVSTIIDEPAAASVALGIDDGIVVDVGGGTTGISVLEGGEVIYAADEATGGFHFDLVIAGAMGISVEEAEKMKKDSSQQKKLFPVVKPVMEKVASITRRFVADYPDKIIYLVGGTCSYSGFVSLMMSELDRKVLLPSHSLLITPLGMAMACRNYAIAN